MKMLTKFRFKNIFAGSIALCIADCNAKSIAPNQYLPFLSFPFPTSPFLFNEKLPLQRSSGRCLQFVGANYPGAAGGVEDHMSSAGDLL